MIFQLLIIQVITVIALIFVFRVLFYRQLTVALGRLKRLHEEGLAREEELKKELNQIKIQKEEELVGARAEAGKLIAEAREKSEKLSLDISAQAKEQAKKTIEQAHIGIEKSERELAAQYQEHAIDLAMKMLRAVFTGQGEEALQHQLIVELMGEIKNLGQDSFTVKAKEVRAFTAFALVAEEKQQLTQIFSEKLSLPVELKETIDKEIIAGLIIQIGALTIDGSLKNKLKKIAPFLKDEI